AARRPGWATWTRSDRRGIAGSATGLLTGATGALWDARRGGRRRRHRGTGRVRVGDQRSAGSASERPSNRGALAGVSARGGTGLGAGRPGRAVSALAVAIHRR